MEKLTNQALVTPTLDDFTEYMHSGFSASAVCKAKILHQWAFGLRWQAKQFKLLVMWPILKNI